MIIKTFLELALPFITQTIMKLLKKKLFKRGEIHAFVRIDNEIED